MGSYIPSTKEERQEMLAAAGYDSIRSLFKDVPAEVYLDKPLNLPQGMSELEVRAKMQELAGKNTVFGTILRGAGAYDHYIPSIVKYITSKEEFVTSYTPYQAEMSQGILQSIFEYQTMICDLTGMDTANASVYDGASAAAEAAAMCRDRKRSVALVSAAANPDVIATMQTYCFGAGTELRLVPAKDGRTDMTVDGDEWKPETQTGYVLALHFGLCDEKNRAAFADRLAKLVEENGGRMTTGFVGTPYLLHALSENGRTDLAYSLLLQEQTPSWLYAVNHGATTVWEHWNSQKEDGSFWSTSMNSFNHYAYGAVFDWIFGVAAGIAPLTAGYETTRVAPHPDRRLGFAKTAIETRHGKLSVHWYYRDERVVYELIVPAAMTVEFVLPSGKTHMLTKGSWLFAE